MNNKTYLQPDLEDWKIEVKREECSAKWYDVAMCGYAKMYMRLCPQTGKQFGEDT